VSISPVSLTTDQRSILAALPTRLISMRAWRQTPRHREPLDLLPVARTAGRWHDAGDPAPCYAGSSQFAVMQEQVRTIIVDPGEEPALPVMLLSELHVRDLPTVDLASDATLDELTADGRGPDARVRRRPGQRDLSRDRRGGEEAR